MVKEMTIEQIIEDVWTNDISTEEYRKHAFSTEEERHRNIIHLHQKMYIKLPMTDKEEIKQRIKNAYELQARREGNIPHRDATGRITAAKPSAESVGETFEEKLENIAYALKPIFVEDRWNQAMKKLQHGLNLFVQSSTDPEIKGIYRILLTGVFDDYTQCVLAFILTRYPSMFLIPYMEA